MTQAWRTQIASDVVRDGLGLELIDAVDGVVAEVFRCDADHTLTVSLFQALPFAAVEWLVESARERLGSFEDGMPLPSGFLGFNVSPAAAAGERGRCPLGGSMDEQLPLAEKLASISADLLSTTRFEAFVHRLFAVASGSWQSVAECCSELQELPDNAAEVFAEHGEAFLVTHLPWPGVSYGRPEDSYALVLFIHNGEFWSTIAAFNLTVLSRGRTTG